MLPNINKLLLKYSRVQRCTCRLLNSAPRKHPASKSNLLSRSALLICPFTCLCLAYWQIQRRKWKENLIADIQKKYEMEPVELPKDLSKLKDLELCPVKVRGHFDYANEVYIGPKSDTVVSDQNVFQIGANRVQGAHVITPFKLSDRDLTILVNRGWYEDTKLVSKEARQKGQVYGEQEIVGVIRHDQDTSAMFWKFLIDFDTPNRKYDCDIYLVRKIDVLAKRCGTAPVFMDAKMVMKSTAEPKPIELGVELRNNHMSYIITWLSLAFITTAMWYRRYSAPARSSSVDAYISQRSASGQVGKSKT